MPASSSNVPAGPAPSPRRTTPGMFRGLVDSFSHGVLRGWAVDVLGRGPVTLHLLADGQEIEQITCNLPRGDVSEALGLESSELGFEHMLPEFLFDDRPHRIALRFSDRSVLPLPDADGNPTLESASFDSALLPETRSFIDGLENATLRGWVTRRPNPRAPWRGGQLLSVSVDGIDLGTYRANHFRGDVGAALKGDPACGFEIPIPGHLHDRRVHRFEILLLPEQSGQEAEPLQNSPYVTTLVDDQLAGQLVEMEGVVTELHRQITRLRREMRALLPTERPTLQHYSRWAEQNRARLLAATAQARVTRPLPEKPPLISVLCPVWKPLARDFEAAIESVRNQTYENWELILVDDGAVCPATSATIKRYAKLDSRIRPVTLKKNVGIAAATNVAIREARGKWVAFFDHDDLLVDVALETMMRAALKSGAKLLYSDEDKVDPAGRFLEPHFKPDFDHRFLMGCNYICHLVLIETKTLRALGPLDSTYNGAQDHDLMLRAAEQIPHPAIHHVPEILYHWRKTENSTAATIANKDYAVQAGVDAVQAHLDRLGLKGEVSAINGVTHYRVAWLERQAPPVTVIIPFRDYPELTGRCVEDFLTSQTYPDFRIVLVDNFSSRPETRQLLEKLSQDPRISVLRIEEGFNYSRLNNLAVAASLTPENEDGFLLFLNNDVFVTQPDFLTCMVQEALSLPRVGAVGAKLVYPNRTIQHAGIAVGPEMIGTHVHHGLPEHAYGYVGRICLSHEVTGVTGAAMLVPRSVFREVGGFDEEQLSVAYNDVDLCLKIRAGGWRVLYCADATAEHHESLSRGTDDHPEREKRWFHESEIMRERWGGHPLFERDPAYPYAFRQDRQTFYDLRDPEEL
ncbi:glycosyltransferase family 2 protein [Oecophyllibacter saccharovorans]|uniref:glycosyltransferase family 2 protein n=1 Tax=Oecophyllibacter saccharovorans TaxID=2558360 RepID=UPI001F4FC3D8|nr:glycosyltransferase family 2 protein [Oecophyllibacter saccharovorans]